MPVLSDHSSFKSVERIIRYRLLPSGGWRALFSSVSLNLDQPTTINLARELLKPLDLEEIHALRSQFPDIPPDTQRAIERGDPARSLLYHLLASPTVLPDESTASYLTIAELEALENYIYVAPLTVSAIQDDDEQTIIAAPSIENLIAQAQILDDSITEPSQLAVVVFSQEYRAGDQSVHRKHADMCFSRVGIARVGTVENHYEVKRRGFTPLVGDTPRDIAVSPIRYAAYVAILLRESPHTFGPLGATEKTRAAGDEARSYWVPLHKLFSSDECIAGFNLSLNFSTHHVNEKIRRFHQFLATHGFDAGFCEEARERHGLARPPFLLTEGLATLDPIASIPTRATSSVLVTPTPQPLVKRASESFTVPSEINIPNAIHVGLVLSSLVVRDDKENPRYRKAPEYIHIRDEVAPPPTPADPPGSRDANDFADMPTRLLLPDRRVWHYTDSTADGWVAVEVILLDHQKWPIQTHLPAYSIVAAPDFYPAVTQYDLELWIKRRGKDGDTWETPPHEKIYETYPSSLSQERFHPNLTLVNADEMPVFTRDLPSSLTMTALVTLPGPRGRLSELRLSNPTFGFDEESGEFMLPSVLRSLGLPDKGAGVFEPGWDIGLDETEGRKHFASYSLGSPFPEDAKLCAALNAYWPAVAPDTSRTFMDKQPLIDAGETTTERVIAPMIDAEIGGGISVVTDATTIPVGGWDGIPGPHLLPDRAHLRHPNLIFADYTVNANSKFFSASLTSLVNTKQYLDRIRAMHLVRGHLFSQKKPDKPEESKLDDLDKTFKLISVEEGVESYYFRFAALKETMPEADAHRFFISKLDEPFTLILDKRNLTVTQHPGLVAMEDLNPREKLDPREKEGLRGLTVKRTAITP